jgi:hypothetical protein
MKVTYCDWCGEKIIAFPYVVKITHRHPFFGNTSKEYEVCEKCADNYQHPLSEETKEEPAANGEPSFKEWNK